MSNENTPGRTDESIKPVSVDPVKTAGDPKREQEQKAAPAQTDKNEPVRK